MPAFRRTAVAVSCTAAVIVALTLIQRERAPAAPPTPPASPLASASDHRFEVTSPPSATPADPRDTWDKLDPRAAAHRALALDDPALTADLLDAWFRRCVSHRPEAVVDWLLSEPAAQRGTWLQLVLAALREQPAELAQLAASLSSLAPTPERDALLAQFAETWSAAQPQAAVEFAATLPDSLGRTHALTRSLQNWIASDVSAASAWLARLAPGPELDTPVFALATDPALAAFPAVAAQWAERIVNPDVRLQGIRVVADTWATRDPAAARQFVATTSALSEEFRRTLLAELDRPPAS